MAVRANLAFTSLSRIATMVLIAALFLVWGTGQNSGVAQDNPIGPVYVISGEGMIEEQANFFDLEGRTVRFTPDGDGYLIENVVLNFSSSVGVKLDPTTAEFGGGASWERQLPFEFSFAGRAWNRVFVNTNGNLSFQSSEANSWPSRDPWAAGTMNSVSDAITSRASSAEEYMIAALWGMYAPWNGGVFVSTADGAFTVTWRVTREVGFNAFYDPLGQNEFQVRLLPSGVIEMSYRDISEKDGFAGLITGQLPKGERVDTVTDRRGDSTKAETDITQVDVYDTGDSVRFVFTIATTVPKQIPGGQLWYRIFIRRSAGDCDYSLGIFDTGGFPGNACGVDASASANGNRVDIFVPKSILDDPTRIAWRADVGWWDFPNQGDFIGDEVGQFNFRNTSLGAFTGAAGLDISEADGVQSQLLEVFHYPVINKDFQVNMPKIFAKVPDTDMAIVLTDFRSDDIFGHGGSTGGVNVAIQGIGDAEADPWGSIAELGSARLQVAAQPTFVGQQRFDEVIREDDNTYIHHAGAVGWMAHELGHRWGVGLEYVNPDTGQREDLVDEWCFCHWDESVHTPSVIEVGSHYTQGGYVTENSPMGGFEWRALGGNRYSRQFPPYLTPYGFSALDLYAMGLIPASEVPDTFVLKNLREQGNDVWTGDRVEISIEDVIAAEGSRTPSFANSQKEFELTFYVIYDPANGPVFEMVARAMRIAGELKDYFERATGGRMTITLGGDVTDPSQVSEVSENPSSADSDGDGVPDEDDLCPTFPGSAAADGC